VVLTSPTSGGLSVGIVRSRTQATEFNFSLHGLKCCTKLFPGSIVNRGTMLQAGKLNVRFPMSLDVSIDQTLESTSNINKIQATFLRVRGGWRLRLTISPQRLESIV
jgi:hypothetical protein